MTILITKPSHDKATSYLASWVSDVISSRKSGNFKILADHEVTREQTEECLKKLKPGLILFNGHGSEDEIQGHNDEVIVKKGLNHTALKNTIVYALACDSAVELGPAAVKSGTKAYIGYDFPFGFLTNKFKECTPEKDELANFFKKPSNQIGISLIKGRTAREAYESSQAAFRKMISSIGSSETLPESKDIRFWLFCDMSSQRLLGDPDSFMTN